MSIIRTRLSFACGGCLLVVFTAFVQSRTATSSQSSLRDGVRAASSGWAQPKRVVRTQVVESAEDIKVTVPVVNGTATMQQVAAVRPSCGCMSAFVEPHQVSPGERAELTLLVSTAGTSQSKPTQKNVSCTVELEPAGSFRTELQLTLLPRVLVDRSDLDLGDVCSGIPLSHDVPLRVLVQGGQVPMLEVESLDQQISVAEQPVEWVRGEASPADGWSQFMATTRLQVTPLVGGDDERAPIRLRFTGVGMPGERDVVLTWNIPDAIQCFPETAIIRNLVAEPQQRLQFTVLGDCRPEDIVAARSQHPDLLSGDVTAEECSDGLQLSVVIRRPPSRLVYGRLHLQIRELAVKPVLNYILVP